MALKQYKLYVYGITLRMGEYEHFWRYYCKAYSLAEAKKIAKQSLFDRSYWDINNLRKDEDDRYWAPGDEAYLHVDYVQQTNAIAFDSFIIPINLLDFSNE